VKSLAAETENAVYQPYT